MEHFKLSKNKYHSGFILLLAAASALYLLNINFSQIWIDEAFTKELVKKPLNEFFNYLVEDFHPPLYFLALKIFTSIVGVTNFTIRLFSVFGSLSIVFLIYRIGKKILGSEGAILYALLVFALPFLVGHTHDARMYTWAAFITTGVFFSSLLAIRTGKTGNYILLGVFTLSALYIHYYCLIAAFWANIFISIYLLRNNKRKWFLHAIISVIVALLYMPWIIVLVAQVQSVKSDFWIPVLTWDAIFNFYLFPFANKFFIPATSYILIAIAYGLTFLSIYKNYISKKHSDRTITGLSLWMFNMTLVTAVLISIFIKPILVSRYAMTVIPLIVVAPAIFIARLRITWLKYTITVIFVGVSLGISIEYSDISMGNYVETIDYIKKNYPTVEKMVHISEVTGPMVLYSPVGEMDHYLLKNEKASIYTNMKVFKDLHVVDRLEEAVRDEEMFCVTNLPDFDLNKDNLDWILGQNQVIKCDTIWNTDGVSFVVYILKKNAHI